MSIYYSQEYQDRILEEKIFKGYKFGIFVDVGAHDGKTYNNTLYFENNNKWQGYNIEPIKSVFNKLVINRPNSININCAINNSDGISDFILNTGYTEMISGLKDTYDNRHFHRLNLELCEYGGTSNIIKVNTKKLSTIFDEYNVKYINYLSIDTEGSEFNVIQSIDFDKVFIDIIQFENNYQDITKKIIKFLIEKNYEILNLPITIDTIMINKGSKFNIF